MVRKLHINKCNLVAEDVPTIGLQNVNTTGTVAGTSITGKPSTLTTYEPITITNTQSSATKLHLLMCNSPAMTVL